MPAGLAGAGFWDLRQKALSRRIQGVTGPALVACCTGPLGDDRFPHLRSCCSSSACKSLMNRSGTGSKVTSEYESLSKRPISAWIERSNTELSGIVFVLGA